MNLQQVLALLNLQQVLAFLEDEADTPQALQFAIAALTTAMNKLEASSTNIFVTDAEKLIYDFVLSRLQAALAALPATS